MSSRPLALWLVLGLLALAAACGANKQFNEKEVCGAMGCDSCIGAQCPTDSGTADAGP